MPAADGYNMAYGALSLGGVNSTPYNWAKLINTSRDTTSEWIPLEQIREQLNIYGDTSQDAYLSLLELAARFHIEDYLGKPIFEQTYTLYYSTSVLVQPTVQLDVPQSDTHTLVVDEIGFYNQTTPIPDVEILDPTTYYLDATGSKIILTSLAQEISTSMTNPIYAKIRITEDVVSTYPSVIHAGRLLITHLYNSRSAVGDTVGEKAEIPFGIQSLLRPYKDLVM